MRSLRRVKQKREGRRFVVELSDGAALPPGIVLQASEPTAAARGWPGIPAGHDTLVVLPLRDLPADIVFLQPLANYMFPAFAVGGTHYGFHRLWWCAG